MNNIFTHIFTHVFVVVIAVALFAVIIGNSKEFQEGKMLRVLVNDALLQCEKTVATDKFCTFEIVTDTQLRH